MAGIEARVGEQLAPGVVLDVDPEAVEGPTNLGGVGECFLDKRHGDSEW